MSDKIQFIRDYTLRLLARREYSRRELLRQITYKYRITEDEISRVESLLTQLSDEGLQSDERFCESYIRSRLVRGIGPLRLKQELYDKGVAQAIVDDKFLSLEIDWFEEARAVKCKRFGSQPPKGLKERAKQYRFMQSRGFTPSQIESVISGTHAATID